MVQYTGPVATYGGMTQAFQEGQSAAQQARLKEEEAARLNRQQIAQQRALEEQIRASQSSTARAQSQEARQAQAFAEQQRQRAALRRAMDIPLEGGVTAPPTPATPTTTPGVRPFVELPTAPAAGRPPGMMRLGGEPEINRDIPAGPPAFAAGLAASGAQIPTQQSYFESTFPRLSKFISTGELQPFRLPAPTTVETPPTTPTSIAGVTPPAPAPSAAEEITSTPPEKPIERTDVGSRLLVAEKAQVAKARKELQTLRKQVTRSMEVARASDDYNTFSNLQLQLLKIDNQLQDKDRMDRLLTFRDAKPGSEAARKALAPLAGLLNELTNGRVEVEPLSDGTYNLYDSQEDPDTPFTATPLTHDDLWNQFDIAFNADRIAREQAAIAAQTELQSTYSGEYAKTAAKELAAAQVRQQYPQANYKIAKDDEGQDVVVSEDPRFPAFRFTTIPDLDPMGKQKLDEAGRPMTKTGVQQIPIPNAPLGAGGSIIPGWQGPTSPRGIPVQ